jgi:hypothetical protein
MEEKPRFDRSIKSLAWLILNDQADVGGAEGFAAAEWKDRLAQIASGGN